MHFRDGWANDYCDAAGAMGVKVILRIGKWSAVRTLQELAATANRDEAARRLDPSGYLRMTFQLR